jgi:hypothetical protein
MQSLLAAGVVQSVVIFLGVLVCVGIVWWATGWIVGTWGLPDIVSKAIYSVLVLVLVVFLIDLVMAITGGPRVVPWG